MNVALSRGTWLGKKYRTQIITPFSRKEKKTILKLAARLKVPAEFTWSCYGNRKTPCGRCGGCVSRSNAFKQLGLTESRRS
jgi:7-cyano-7-deazaguanine synthase